MADAGNTIFSADGERIARAAMNWVMAVSTAVDDSYRITTDGKLVVPSERGVLANDASNNRPTNC